MRYRYEFIPNSLYEFLKKYNRVPLEIIRNDFNDDDWSIVETYLAFLLEKDFIFYSDKPELFPDVQIAWESSLQITNAVLDIDANSDHDFAKIFYELNNMRCESAEFRIFTEKDQEFIKNIIDHTKNSSLRSVYLLAKYNKDHSRKFFEELIRSNRRIMSVTIHTTPQNFVDTQSTEDGNFFNITFIQQEINSEEHCGAISKLNFSTSISMFMESHLYNSCLNKKVSVDKKGFVKNCPSSSENFGHHKSASISKIVATDTFQRYWNITKDQVLICQDCEFRYICTDCRVYREDDANIRSKPKKCDYDPYSAVWNTEKYEVSGPN
jgi:SPASM domain peptide maturase of grasp-with-spasm system